MQLLFFLGPYFPFLNEVVQDSDISTNRNTFKVSDLWMHSEHRHTSMMTFSVTVEASVSKSETSHWCDFAAWTRLLKSHLARS